MVEEQEEKQEEQEEQKEGRPEEVKGRKKQEDDKYFPYKIISSTVLISWFISMIDLTLSFKNGLTMA